MIYKLHRARQQGSIYVVVMAVTSIVGVVGLSSLLAVRIEHRDVLVRADATQAQALVDSGLHVIHARLSDDADWRSRHADNAWSSTEAFGNGALDYKLIDEDGVLADDPDDPARLIVRVAFGDAVRLASVLIGGEADRGDPTDPLPVVRGSYRKEINPI
ncbi:MAG: hypothetical protein AAF333_01300 [Planctomycetota bacterium]